MKELVVVARVFSGIEIALKTGHWEHSGSPAYYHFIRKLDLRGDFTYKLYLLSPNATEINKQRMVSFDNLSVTAKVIPYYSIPFSKNFYLLKKMEFFYNKFRQYILVLLDTHSSRYYYIDRGNIMLSFLLLLTSSSNIVITRLLGVPESLYRHLEFRSNIFSKIIRWTFKNRRSYFICTNDGSFAEVVKRKFGKDRFYLLFNGVNKNIPSQLKIKDNKDDNKIIISYISRIEKNKGHVNFINSLSKLTSYDNLAVYIIGDGNFKSQCEDLVNKYKLDNVVFFTGRVNHNKAMEYLLGSHIFIYINYEGSFGNSVLEAAQFGLPVVTLKHKSFPSEKYPFFKFILYYLIHNNSLNKKEIK